MIAFDSPISIRERARDQIVAQLGRLVERCEEFDLPFGECLREAEQQLLEQDDAAPASSTVAADVPFTGIVLIASPAKVRRYHSRDTIVDKLAARGVSWDIGGLALALGRSVRYVHALVREEPRTLIDPDGQSRVSDFRVHLRSWPTQG